VQRSAERRLEAHAMRLHPRQMALGLADGHAREPLVGEASGHLEEVLPVFLLGIGIGEHVERPGMHGAHVARVPAVAAAERSWSGLHDQHRESQPAGGDGGAQRGIAAAQHQQVECAG
jgi:hypothetical protein